MSNYKEMYFHLFKISEQVINMLIAVQRECEELYISSSEPKSRVISISPEKRAWMRSNSNPHSYILLAANFLKASDQMNTKEASYAGLKMGTITAKAGTSEGGH